MNLLGESLSDSWGYATTAEMSASKSRLESRLESNLHDRLHDYTNSEFYIIITNPRLFPIFLSIYNRNQEKLYESTR